MAAGLLATAPASAQDATPQVPTAVVLPAHSGEAVRVTMASPSLPQPGRLARRYKGLYVNRTEPAAPTVRRGRAVNPLVPSPRGAFVRRAGSYFPVLPAR